jgi:hypothetical protein
VGEIKLSSAGVICPSEFACLGVFEDMSPGDFPFAVAHSVSLVDGFFR